MMKKMVAVVMALCLVAAPVSCFAEDETDYSYLEDMTVKELKALRDAINEILGDEKNSDTEESSNENKNVVEGIYCSLNDPNNYFEFTPDNSEKTYGSYKRESEILGTRVGEYRISADLITIGDTVYTISGDYLIPHEYDWEGIIPNENLFECTISYDAVDYCNTISFKSDGTFEYMTQIFDELLLNPGEDDVTIKKGTYIRNDDLITLNYSDGDTDVGYVGNGIYNNSVRVKKN